MHLEACQRLGVRRQLVAVAVSCCFAWRLWLWLWLWLLLWCPVIALGQICVLFSVLRGDTIKQHNFTRRLEEVVSILSATIWASCGTKSRHFSHPSVKVSDSLQNTALQNTWL